LKNSQSFFSKSVRLAFFDDAEEDGGIDDDDEDEDGASLLPDPE
jgi:hypothetical protein